MCEEVLLLGKLIYEYLESIQIFNGTMNYDFFMYKSKYSYTRVQNVGFTTLYDD